MFQSNALLTSPKSEMVALEFADGVGLVQSIELSRHGFGEDEKEDDPEDEEEDRDGRGQVQERKKAQDERYWTCRLIKHGHVEVRLSD